MGKKLYGIANSLDGWMKNGYGNMFYFKHKRLARALAAAMGNDFKDVPFRVCEIGVDGSPIEIIAKSTPLTRRDMEEILGGIKVK